MTLRSGLAIQTGYAAEAATAEIETPQQFLPVADLPSLTVGGDPTESEGIIAGRRVLTSDQWNGGNLTVGGDVSHELYDHGMDVLFRAMFGQMVQTGNGPYTHTHTPGDLSDDSLTVQLGVPSLEEGVVPATFGGCHVASWEIACEQGAIATLGVTFAGMNGHMGARAVEVDYAEGFPVLGGAAGEFSGDAGKPVTGEDIPAGTLITSVSPDGGTARLSKGPTAGGSDAEVTIGTPLATAVYPSRLRPMKSMYLGLEVDGDDMPLQSLTVAGDNGLTVDRYLAGSPWPAQPLEGDLRTYTGTIETEFRDTAAWELFRSGAEAALKAMFRLGDNRIEITGNVRFDANPPTGNTRGIVGQSLPIKFVADGSDDTAIKLVTVNSDNLS